MKRLPKLTEGPVLRPEPARRGNIGSTACGIADGWAIVEARGPWLFVSRNVSVAFSIGPEEKPYGLLSRGSAAELLVFAERLVGRLHGRV